MSLNIRQLTRDDIPATLELCRMSGWNQLAEDWTRLIQYEPDGCFAVEIDGHVVGTVTTTTYGIDLAWIGMMLVHEDYRRRGIATDLINTSHQYLGRSKVRCIKLDATPTGAKVYERLGFRSEFSFQRWTRQSTERQTRRESVSREVLHDFHYDLDRTAFGVERADWLRRLADESTVCVRDGGFGMLRRGFLADYLGPIVAKDDDVARDIIRELLDRSTAEQTFWDVPHPGSAEIAQQLGFNPVRELIRMRTGESSVLSSRELQFAICDPATG